MEAIAFTITGVVAFIRLEGKINAGRDRMAENLKLIEKLETRMEKAETRHDVVYSDVRTLLSAMNSSISRVEGVLKIKA